MAQIIINISSDHLAKYKALYAVDYAIYVAELEAIEQTPLSENDYLKRQAMDLLRQDYRRRKRKELLNAVNAPDDIDLT